VASHVGCTLEFCYDADILALAERTARAFPEIPLLGIDILRDAESGALHVIEVNSSGQCWGFSSGLGNSMQGRLGQRYESQFDAFARAARVLIEQTRLLAR
jgi:glutathione synthase/RimK-type ligase-like ATP-grasp enzyme